MADAQQNQNDVDQVILRKLQERAETIEERIEKIDKAKRVTQDALRLEFDV